MVPVGHFGLGSSIAFVINMIIYFARKCRTTFRHLVLMPVSMVLAGFWAFGPDWARLLRFFLHRAAYSGKAHEPGWPDIFFFHGTFDTRYPGGGSISGLIATLFVFSSLIVIYLLEIKRLSAKARKSK